MSIPEIVSVAKAKAHLSRLLKEVCQGKVYEVINRSEAVAVIISVDGYKALLEQLEDMDDGVFVMQSRLEDYHKACGPYEEVMNRYWAEHPEEAPVPWEQFKAEYWAEHPDDERDVQGRD